MYNKEADRYRLAKRLLRIGMIVTPIGLISLVAFTLIQDYPLYAAHDPQTLLANLARVEIGKYWGQIFEGCFFLVYFLYAKREIEWNHQQFQHLQQAKSIEHPASISIPNGASSLILPFTIWLRPSSRAIRSKTIGMIFGSAIALFVIFSGPTASWYMWLIKTLIYILVIVAAGLIIFATERARYEITEQGITLSRIGQSNAIQWQAAHSFMVRSMQVSRQATPRVYYELSDITGKKVSWYPVENTSRVLISPHQTLPNSEFNDHLINQLNALVVARTGLPLIDQRIHATTSSTETDQSS